MPTWGDFFALSAYITPLWIFSGALLGFVGLWEMNRKALIVGWTGLSVVLIAGSWWSGAQQVATLRSQQTVQDRIEQTEQSLDQKQRALNSLQKTLNKQQGSMGKHLDELVRLTHSRPDEPPAKIVDAAVAKIKELDDTLAAVQAVQSQVGTLNAELGPRTIPVAAAEHITKVLRKLSWATVGIRYVFGDPEAEQYAGQLAKVIRDGGWTVDGPTAVEGSHYPPGLKGLFVAVDPSVKDPLSFPASAVVLGMLLHAEGLQISQTAISDPKIESMTDCQLVVETKP